ncbi:MAG: D-alanyl-D-alanine carboxypeptidase/D-alanyl-D-alanine-endopeptidase [Candidatus Acidoferrales bacterium]
MPQLLRLLPVLLFLLLPAFLPSALAQEAGEAELGRRIEEIIQQGGAGKGFWGIEVYSPARGRVIYSRNADRYFSPASVTKLFPTAAALALEGPDYRFRTLVGARARIDRLGRLLGHLYFVGGGDPDLGGCALPYSPEEEEDDCDPTAVLDELAQQVRRQGVETIMGDLIIDQSFFSMEPYPVEWTVGDLLWSYGAPVRALSLADNTLTITVEPGERPGDPARLTWKPDSRFYEILNSTWTAGETLLWVRRDPGSRVLEISGPVAFSLEPKEVRELRIAIEEPSLFIGELFLDALERQGVQLRGQIRVNFLPAPPFTGEQTRLLPLLLAEHLSRALVEDVTLVNKTSQNLHAEMLLRLLGRREPPQAPLEERPRQPHEPPPRRGDGSTEAGLEVLRAWLANAGVNPRDVELYDGSGLSRRNLVTPHAVVRLLGYADAQPWGPLFRESLAVAGVDGTLKERMRNSPARGRVRAKSGTLAHTNALAGFVETQSGERLIFAIIVNHHTLPEGEALGLLDEICAALVELPPEEKKIENRN